jgi:purine-binding chemotaxis protein CheW
VRRAKVGAERHRLDVDRSLVGFVVGDAAYAVPIGSVREIVRPAEVTELPHAPSDVVGVVDHRGEVVPVVSMRRRLGLAELTDCSRCKWILVQVAGCTLGLVVDRVTDVFGTGDGSLRPPPAVEGGRTARGFAGVVNHEGRLVYVLELDSLRELLANVGPLASASELHEVAR